MGPGQPLEPVAQEGAWGRQYDYPWGVNLQYTPRASEPVSFAQLRALADGYDLIRLLIETRKDQLVKFEWAIMPRDESKDTDDRCVEFTNFLQYPDRRHNWQTWLRALVEDMLVTDAACIQPVLTRGGDLYSLDWFDGATLHLMVDDTGRSPLPPDVAYQQITKGVPAVDYSADELIYAPRNQRVNRLFGYGPVEQILMTVNIALRRQLSQLQYFTEGNIPEALVTVPKEWTPEQIKRYQEMWDIKYAGNTAERSHLHFIPYGTKYYDTKSDVLKDVFDEWLARVCCFAFSLPAAPFVREQNRATAETAKEAALEEGLHPLMSWIRDLLNLVLWKYKGWYDLQFIWQDEEPTSPVELMTMNSGYVKSGIKSIDEARQDLGLDSVGMPNAIFTGAGVILLKDILHPEESPMNALGVQAVQAGQAVNNEAGGGGVGIKPAVQSDGKSREKQTSGEPSAAEGNMPAHKFLDVHVHMPKQPDVLVDIGPTTINAKFEPQIPLAKGSPNRLVEQTITTERAPNGDLVTVITDTSKRTVTATRDADGAMSARIKDG